MTGNRWICRLVPENQECAGFEETQNSKSCKNVYTVKKVCGMSHGVKVCKYFSLLKKQIRAAANIKF